MESAGERFDTIVLDPPAFAKNRASVRAAARGYKEINLRALKMLAPGGHLVTCTCSYHMTEPLFLEVIAEAARDARRRVQIVERRTQSRDHPVLARRPRDALPQVRRPARRRMSRDSAAPRPGVVFPRRLEDNARAAETHCESAASRAPRGPLNNF